MDKLLKIKELAAITGLNVVTLRQWQSQGKIPFIRLSRKAVRYRLSDVEAWIKSKEVNLNGFQKVE